MVARKQNQKIRIRLKAYDHRILDQSASKIVETAESTGDQPHSLRPVRRSRPLDREFDIRTHSGIERTTLYGPTGPLMVAYRVELGAAGRCTCGRG